MQDSQSRQQQKQKYAERQIELLNEFQYTIIQDMQNVLGIALEFHAVEEREKLDPDLVKVQKNRLILQYNLSNTIHADQQQTAESKNVVSELSKQKINAQEMFTKIKQELYKAMPKLQSSAAGQILEDYHTNNLSLDCKIIQKPLEKTNVKANFNQDVVAQVLGAMQANDQIYDGIRNSKQLIQFDDSEKIKQNALNRFVNAKVKLQESLESTHTEIVVEQTPITQTEQQKVADFVVLLFSGLANYFAQQIIQNEVMLFGVIQIAYENKIDLQKLHKHLQQAQKNLPHCAQLFEMLLNYLNSGEQIYNPCSILSNIKLPEGELYFLKSYKSEIKSKEFWESKYMKFNQISITLFQGIRDIFLNKKTSRLNFPLQDNYDAFLKNKIIELHFPFFKSSQTQQLLLQLRDEVNYTKPEISMTDNLKFDLNYITQNLKEMQK